MYSPYNTQKIINNVENLILLNEALGQLVESQDEGLDNALKVFIKSTCTKFCKEIEKVEWDTVCWKTASREIAKKYETIQRKVSDGNKI